jgi:hypothetical protein
LVSSIRSRTFFSSPWGLSLFLGIRLSVIMVIFLVGLLVTGGGKSCSVRDGSVVCGHFGTRHDGVGAG